MTVASFPLKVIRNIFVKIEFLSKLASLIKQEAEEEMTSTCDLTFPLTAVKEVNLVGQQSEPIS